MIKFCKKNNKNKFSRTYKITGIIQGENLCYKLPLVTLMLQKIIIFHLNKI